MLASALEDALINAGFEIAGVAGRLETALALIKIGDCDGAVVDATLTGISAGPATLALSERAIPFVVMSGYTREQLPFPFAGGIFIQKPARNEQLVQALQSALSAHVAKA